MKKYDIVIANIATGGTKVIFYDGLDIVSSHNVGEDDTFVWMSITEEQYSKIQPKLMSEDLEDRDIDDDVKAAVEADLQYRRPYHLHYKKAVSYTHLRAPRDRQKSRMPSSA